MKSAILAIIANLIFTPVLFQTAEAQKQTALKISPKETSLLNFFAKDRERYDYDPVYRKYLRVTIGKITYLIDLKSGKVDSREKIDYYTSGGFSGAYAEVQINVMNADKLEAGQGSGRILKLTGGKWKLVASNETDYQCRAVKTVPKAVLKALKVECFDED